MTPAGTLALTALAMTAFAGNSLLCRIALKHTSLDAASFTTLRLLSGALVLWLVAQRPERRGQLAIALSLCMLMFKSASLDAAGVGYAVASGALTSGLGYALWYAVLPFIKP